MSRVRNRCMPSRPRLSSIPGDVPIVSRKIPARSNSNKGSAAGLGGSNLWDRVAVPRKFEVRSSGARSSGNAVRSIGEYAVGEIRVCKHEEDGMQFILMIGLSNVLQILNKHFQAVRWTVMFSCGQLTHRSATLYYAWQLSRFTRNVEI